jgi:hypothetical protein
MPYPDYLIRGIPNQSFIDEDDLVSAQLFYFNKPESVRLSGYLEESINWHDDAGAIEHTFNQTKEDGTVQFKAGIAILSRSELDRLKNNPRLKNRFNYERCCLPTNQYHGNMLLKVDASKQLKRMIAATLALNVSQIIKREDHESQ